VEEAGIDFRISSIINSLTKLEGNLKSLRTCNQTLEDALFSKDDIP